MQCRRPERMVVVLAALHAIADIGGVVRPAFFVDDDRQIAAVADRIHGGEEDEFVAAEQILRVVLGSREQHIDAGLLHQPVDPCLVERNVADGTLDRSNVHLFLPELPEVADRAAADPQVVDQICTISPALVQPEIGE